MVISHHNRRDLYHNGGLVRYALLSVFRIAQITFCSVVACFPSSKLFFVATEECGASVHLLAASEEVHCCLCYATWYREHILLLCPVLLRDIFLFLRMSRC